MQYLGMAVAVVVLVGAASSGAMAQNTAAMEEYRLPSLSVSTACTQVARGFERTRSFAELGFAAPSESTERTHLEAVIYLLEGYGGPDVTLETMPPVVTGGPSYSLELTEWIAGAERIQRGGLLGAVEDARARLAEHASFVREHAAALIGFYERGHEWAGWDGELIMNAYLDRIDFYWQQIAELVQFSLETALAAQREAHPTAVESALLKIAAFCANVSGYYDSIIRTDVVIEYGAGKDAPCLFREFLLDYDDLSMDVLAALASS
jgi:hypothetical protein